MIKNEWKSLFHNKLLLIVLIAIIAIPVIYAGFFLNSMWDPYGNVDKLPVAIVNKDKPVEYEGETLSVGADMVDELRDNDSLQFNFVDEQVAKEGLKNGTYYMVITIPENFSENATTLMDDDPEKMDLTYETNPGTNYIASKMSETALTKIKDSVSAEVTKTYAETVFDKIQDAGDGMQEAADGAGELKDGIKEASNGNETITENLNTLASSTVTFKNGAASLQSGLKKYTNGVSTLNKKAPILITGVDTLNSGAQQLAEGADSLEEGTNDYVAGTTTLANGLSSYIDGVNQLSAGASSLKAGIDKMYAYIGQLEDMGSTEGLKNLTEKLGKAQAGIKQGATGVNSAASTITQAQKGLSSGKALLEQSVSSANESIKSKNADIDSRVSDVNAQIDKANETIDSANGKIDDINTQVNTANAQIETAEGKIDKQIENAIKKMEEAEEKSDVDLSSQINALKEVQKEEISGVNSVDSISKVNKISNGDEVKGDITLDTSKIDTVTTSLDQAAEGLGKGATSLQSLADQLQEGVNSMPVQLDSSTTSLIESLRGQFKTDEPEEGTIGAGIVQLTAGFNKVTANNEKLTDGADELKTSGKDLTAGAKRVSNGATQLATGTKSLSSGASQLSDGVKTLASNNSTLNSGAGQLKDGAVQIQEGSQKLADGSAELGDGMSQLSDGSDELEDALADGAEEVKENTAEDDNIEMFATPVEDDETQMTTVENNGHAMAPYMMSVGLWVGTLAFCLIYPLMSYKGKLKSGFAWWLSKATVLYPVAALQGLLLIMILHYTIGFSPAEYGKTIAFAILTAMTFTSIMYFFNITLGKVGSFLMLVFMVIQLAGSAGTYPVEISPDFVADIHWYLPFTYTVNSFRSTIAGGESIRSAVIVMIVLFVIFTLLTIGAFMIKAKRRKEGKLILFDWLEERGLA